MAKTRSAAVGGKGKQKIPLTAKFLRRPRAAAAVVLMAVAVTLGLLTSYRAGQNSVMAPTLASQQQIIKAKQDITAKYYAISTRNCVDPTTGAAYDAATYFNKYLQVNAYANRAVIRACNANGQLLTNLHGNWITTEVNLNLSARANPVWATACWANDILSLDSVVRPENASIDSANLKICQALTHDKTLTIEEL